MKALPLLLAATLTIGCTTREEQCDKARLAWLDDRRRALRAIEDPSVQAAAQRALEEDEPAYTAQCLMRSRNDLRCLTSGKTDPECGPAFQRLEDDLRATRKPPPPPAPLVFAEPVKAAPPPPPRQVVRAPEMTVMGSLDKELIRKVIWQNRGQSRYCYESQLNRFPNLAGMVVVKFVISPQGTVAAAQVVSTTADNLEFEKCLTTRVKTWTFPHPKGGGVAIVSNAFVFP